MKRYQNILLFAALLSVQLPVAAQQKKPATQQASSDAINVAAWKDINLADYTFNGRIPLTVKLPAAVKLKKETSGSGYYYMDLNKRLQFNVIKVYNETKTIAEDIADMKKNLEKMAQAGASYKLLIDEPDVLLVASTSKVKFHLLIVHVSKPGDEVHYRFANVRSDYPDTYSDAQWIQIARSLKATAVN